jgi:hypothetical protein
LKAGGPCGFLYTSQSHNQKPRPKVEVFIGNVQGRSQTVTGGPVGGPVRVPKGPQRAPKKVTICLVPNGQNLLLYGTSWVGVLLSDQPQISTNTS